MLCICNSKLNVDLYLSNSAIHSSIFCSLNGHLSLCLKFISLACPDDFDLSCIVVSIDSRVIWQLSQILTTSRDNCTPCFSRFNNSSPSLKTADNSRVSCSVAWGARLADWTYAWVALMTLTDISTMPSTTETAPTASILLKNGSRRS